MVQADNKSYWQRVAKFYGSFMRTGSEEYSRIADLIRPCLRRDMAVLELACGTGQLSYPLSTGVRLWEATDFSENMIAEARRSNGSSLLHFSVADATQLPFGDETYDAVVVSNALHIMPRPEAALAEARRVLKSGGLLFAPTIVWSEGKSTTIWKALLKLSGFRIYHSWSCSDLAAFVEAQGFTVTQVEFLGGRATPMCYLAARK